MNQKHEADVCLHPHGGLAASRLPWQAGFRRCQILEFWPDCVTLLVRPGLPSAFLLFKSEASCSFSCCSIPPLSLGDRKAGGVSRPHDTWEKEGRKHHFLEHCQSTATPRCQETRALETVAAAPSTGWAVGKKFRERRNVVQQETEADPGQMGR